MGTDPEDSAVVAVTAHAPRQSGWKMNPAANMLGINYLNFKSKLESIIKEYIEENQGDLIRVSQSYNIPLKFLKTKMRQVLTGG
jgi:hypothetical protein